MINEEYLTRSVMNPRTTIAVAAAALSCLAECPEPPPAKDEPNYKGYAEPVDGPAAKCGRNDRCPCGSGKKHKKCCRSTHKATWPVPAEPEESNNA